jgi:uncharacterized protein YciW
MTELAEDDVVLAQAAISSGSPVLEPLLARADVIALTQATHDAALRPHHPGGLSHAERAALAMRIARLNRDEGLAAHYGRMMRQAGADAETEKMADPLFDGGAVRRIAAIITYTDLVTVSPRNTKGADIESLKAAGIEDADIVRLSELNAFLAYQIRLVAGLRLMKEQRP